MCLNFNSEQDQNFRAGKHDSQYNQVICKVGKFTFSACYVSTSSATRLDPRCLYSEVSPTDFSGAFPYIRGYRTEAENCSWSSFFCFLVQLYLYNTKEFARDLLLTSWGHSAVASSNTSRLFLALCCIWVTPLLSCWGSLLLTYLPNSAWLTPSCVTSPQESRLEMKLLWWKAFVSATSASSNSPRWIYSLSD